MDVWPRKNSVFSTNTEISNQKLGLFRSGLDRMECQWQSWGMMIDDPDGGHSSIFEHGTCRYWPRWLTWDPKNPKDFRWFEQSLDSQQALYRTFPTFPKQRVPRCWEHHGTPPPIIGIEDGSAWSPRVRWWSQGSHQVWDLWMLCERKKSASDLDQRCSSWFTNIAIWCDPQIWNWNMIRILCWILCSST